MFSLSSGFLLSLYCQGLISLEEFRQTWKLLSSHLKMDISDKAIADLALSIDFNKDGSIDINEFMEAFRLADLSRMAEGSENFAASCSSGSADTAGTVLSRLATPEYRPQPFMVEWAHFRCFLPLFPFSSCHKSTHKVFKLINCHCLSFWV